MQMWNHSLFCGDRSPILNQLSPVTPGVSVESPCAQSKWKSTQSEQDLCSDNLWTPSCAPVTTSSWAVIPSWRAAEQGFSTAHSSLRKPQHICSGVEPSSILCIACLDELSLLIFKTFHSRGLAWNGEPLVSSICRGSKPYQARLPPSCLGQEGIRSSLLQITRLFTLPQWAAHLCCAFFMFLEQCCYLFFPATIQVLEMLLRTSFLPAPSRTLILFILLRRNCPPVLLLCMLDLVGWGEKKCVCKVSH